MTTLEKILNLMKERGFQDVEFAVMLGFSRNAVAEWKNGRLKSYNKHLPKIAEALGVTPQELLDDPEKDIIASPQLIAKTYEHICNVLDYGIEDCLITIGLPENTLDKLKSGMKPNVEIIEKLSDSIHVPVSILLGIEEFDVNKCFPYKSNPESDIILEYYFRLNREDKDYIKGEMIRLYRKKQDE